MKYMIFFVNMAKNIDLRHDKTNKTTRYVANRRLKIAFPSAQLFLYSQQR